jgi:hypothetical protein
MLQRKVLILEGLEAPDTRRASAVAVQEVTALTHEVWNLNVVSLQVGDQKWKLTMRWNLEPL